MGSLPLLAVVAAPRRFSPLRRDAMPATPTLLESTACPARRIYGTGSPLFMAAPSSPRREEGVPTLSQACPSACVIALTELAVGPEPTCPLC